MNKKGHKANLKPEHPGNTNAEKSGVNSPRRRAEEAAKVHESLAENPLRFLAEDQVAMYAGLRGHLKLLGDDLAELGVTDSSGKQRRQAGTYLRTMRACVDLGDSIRAKVAADKLKDDMENPWTEEEAVQRLCEIVRNRSEPAAARIAAIKTLILLVPAGEKPYDVEFFQELHAMSPEQLEKEFQALTSPITTGGAHGNRQEWAEEAIRRMAQLPDLNDDHLRTLYSLIKEELELD